MRAWRVEVFPREGLPDPKGVAAAAALRGAGLEFAGDVTARRGFLLGEQLTPAQVERFAREVLADPVAENFEVFAPDAPDAAPPRRIAVQPRPGVTDPVAHSLQHTLRDCGLPVVATGTYAVFMLSAQVNADAAERAVSKSLANTVVQHVLVDRSPKELPGPGGQADLRVHKVVLRHLADADLLALSTDGGLALNLAEMRAVQTHYLSLGREPTRIELETIAQTWSEHCKHKTLTGKIRYEGRLIDNLLKQTIARVTHTLQRDFCLSVFQDNAGVIAFDDDDAVCIKVETHNHPSAIEPYGGAGTGVGGVIRDVLGTGLAARPICNTDVFCFGPPDLAPSAVPKGCLHPLQVLRGVVAGVRDYGNPMGIPTVNGAVHFDPDFVGNPLVYVGNVGILPRDKINKQARAGDVIVAIGGRTGRDGIHGATFSSLELHTQSESVSSGAVQIGDPITERKVMDATLRARDEGLFSAITDCGAGGFSSAIGEMAAGLGAVVQLERAPLKYAGLAPWEIWVSEAQERMVLAVPKDKLARLLAVCAEEDVEATALGEFHASGKLVLRYGDVVHGELDLHFLHEGLPVIERAARYVPPSLGDPDVAEPRDLGAVLLALLADPNVASKEWLIRQYDHEVQAAAAGKPLCGVRADGPADAAVLAPKLGSRRGLVLACGLNPRYSKIDPAAMAECALDEAMRNVVAAGGDPETTAVLDNYCWGNTSKEQQLGGLVRASEALAELALTFRTPFVSGKDSLNNEFRDGERTIAIPGCILITALSVIPDVARTVSSDLKQAGNLLVLVGTTKRELGGSTYWKSLGHLGRSVPRVDGAQAKKNLDGVARAIQARAVRSAHDLSEGGLAVAAAEMAIGGRLGVEIDLAPVVTQGALRADELLFSESQSRFLLEVEPERQEDLRVNLFEVPCAVIGRVVETPDVVFRTGNRELVRVPLAQAVQAFQRTLDLDGTLAGGAR
jgi:phosphoribosylformylglycinamidine synthase